MTKVPPTNSSPPKLLKFMQPPEDIWVFVVVAPPPDRWGGVQTQLAVELHKGSRTKIWYDPLEWYSRNFTKTNISVRPARWRQGTNQVQVHHQCDGEVILLSCYPVILLSSYPFILLSCYPVIQLSSYPVIQLSSYPFILLSIYPVIPVIGSFDCIHSREGGVKKVFCN